MKFVSIDLETTGFDPEQNDILEIGAVYMHLDPKTGACLEKHNFHYALMHKVVRWNPDTLDFHLKLKTLDRLKTLPTLHPNVVGEALATWLGAVSWNGMKGKYTAAGKNFAKFDYPFLLKLPQFNNYVGFRHRILDLGNLCWNPVKDQEVLPEFSECMKRLGIYHLFATDASPTAKLNLHSALDDATAVAIGIQKLYENACLSSSASRLEQ